MPPRAAAILRAAAFLVFAGIVAGGLYLALAERPFGLDFSEKGLSQRIEGLGPWRGAGIMALMVLHSFVPFPAEIVTFLAGRMLGPMWGTVYAWSGAMLGAVLSFGLARVMGRAFVEALMPAGALSRLQHWSATKSATTLLVARFIPVIAFNLINYAAGLTTVGWWTFLWTTGLGILPLTIFFVILGERMHGATWQDWAIFAAAAAALSAVVHVFQRYARRRGWGALPPQPPRSSA